MTDPMSGPVPQCPWCSAALPPGGGEQCPSCGAQLVSPPGTATDIKGVTTLDAEAILRGRSESSRPRGGLLSLITGDEADAASARQHQESLAQPSEAVRREMARLELEARRTAEEAELTALRAAAMAELGITVDDIAAAEAAAMEGPDVEPPAPAAPDVAAPDADPHGTWPAELEPIEQSADGAAATDDGSSEDTLAEGAPPA